jgi:hypothetical protein
VYCNGWEPNSKNLFHELMLTDFLMLYPWDSLVRGYDVDEKLKQDAAGKLFGNWFDVEQDCGTMNKKKILKRWKKYIESENTVLVNVATKRRNPKARMEQLMEWTKMIPEVAPLFRFTTRDAVMTDPFGEVWLDCEGNRYAIEVTTETTPE